MLLFLLLITTVPIALVKTKCAKENTVLYCTNLENKTLVLGETNTQDDTIKAAYMRNVSGEINNKTFSGFPMLQSLDLQFSSLDNFSPEFNNLDTLYIMYNKKFPNLTNGLLKNCCKSLKILYIFENPGLLIKTGAFKYMEKVTHLNIMKQNITHLTAAFLEGLKQLTYLNLKQNNISIIDKDTFDNLSELNHLTLSNNSLKKFEPETFENLLVLESLELYNLHMDEFNTSIFKELRELKELGVSTKLIKKSLVLEGLTQTFPKLETIGVQSEDIKDTDVAEFIRKCKSSGFYIKYSNN